MSGERYIIQGQTLTNLAEAIREKTGSETDYTPAEMATAIKNLPIVITDEDNGKVVKNRQLVNQTSLTITQAGTYDTTVYNQVIIQIN